MQAQLPFAPDAKLTADDRSVIDLFTDGACIGNPGPGGWAYILRRPGKTMEGSGGELNTTNNRMELTAVIRALETLKCACRIRLHSDSKYVVDGLNEWMPKWKGCGWRRSPKAREQVRNADLWQRLDELLRDHLLTAAWVQGHAGHPENERCDFLATAEAMKIAQAKRSAG